MKDLFNLLSRFTHTLNRDTLIKEKIIQTLEKFTFIELNPDKLEIKDGVLMLEATPVTKSAINLKEDEIKTELKEVHKISIKRILYK